MKEDSLANKVYIELRRKILTNQLLSGMRLKEGYWAEKMGVNRIAVREALTRLLGENLVEFGPKGGHFVKTLTAEEVKEIREIREILELGALKLLFKIKNEERLRLLEEICDDFSNMVQKSYFDGALEADVRFHETIIDLSENQKLKDLYQVSNIPLFHQKLGKSQTHMKDYELTDIEHRTIVGYLRNNDLVGAEATLHQHLIRGEMTTLDIGFE
jgi:DNA-binding GntR family transcriptional regulator